MKYLLLMRHAKSSWKDVSLPDHQRPLNKRGKRDAPRMGRHLRDQGITLDAILSSTAVRARATAKGFLEEYTFEGEVHYFDDLYHADPATILAILSRLPESMETAMVVAHNPGLDEFLDQVCDQAEHMPTASVAHLQLPVEYWGDLGASVRGDLLNLWRPREI